MFCALDPAPAAWASASGFLQGTQCRVPRGAASSSAQTSASLHPSHSAPGRQQLRHSAPPSNKPHPAEKSTPVWLAIWRTWAGFANSQLRCANFPALIYIYASIPIAATLELLLRQTQISRPICTDYLRHLRISAK